MPRQLLFHSLLGAVHHRAHTARPVANPGRRRFIKHGQPLSHFPTLEHVLLAIDSMRHIQHGDQFSRPGQTKTAALSFGAAHQPSA